MVNILGRDFPCYTAAVMCVDNGGYDNGYWLVGGSQVDFFDVLEVMLEQLDRDEREELGRAWLIQAADGVMGGLRDLSVSSSTFQAWHGLLNYVIHNKPLPLMSTAHFAHGGRHALDALEDRRWYTAARYIVFGGDEREVAFAVAKYLDNAGVGRE